MRIIIPRKLAQIVLKYPDGLSSELTLHHDKGGYEIEVEDEICEGCIECGSYDVEAENDEDAKKLFESFAVSYERE